VPGIVYSQTGCVWAPNIPGWEHYPLEGELRTVTPQEINIYIDSDRTCYMYGEMWQGVAQECHSAIFMAVGTGIGAGIIMDGRVMHGANDIIGATGWMALQPPYREEYDACGCFEYYASGNGIGARVRDAVHADKSYRGRLRQKPITRITAHDVFTAYHEGDHIAAEALRKAVEMWGMAAANFVSLLNPEKIIWGGGVFGPATIFLDDIYKEACKWAQPIAIRQVEFVASQLLGNAGLIGAAYLAIRQNEEFLKVEKANAETLSIH
jgi:glucokinase